MSNSLDLRNALLVESFASIELPYPTKYPSAAFTEQPENAPWLRVTPIYGEPIPLAYSTTDRIDGILQIDVFTPKNSGDIIAHQVCDTVRQALPVNGEKRTSGNVSVQFRSVGMSGAPDGDTWDHAIIRATFYTFVDRNA